MDFQSMAKAILEKKAKSTSSGGGEEAEAYKESVKDLMEALKGEDVDRAAELLADAVVLARKTSEE